MHFRARLADEFAVITERHCSVQSHYLHRPTIVISFFLSTNNKNETKKKEIFLWQKVMIINRLQLWYTMNIPDLFTKPSKGYNTWKIFKTKSIYHLSNRPEFEVLYAAGLGEFEDVYKALGHRSALLGDLRFAENSENYRNVWPSWISWIYKPLSVPP